MTGFKLSAKCPATAIVQHLESGDFDYSSHGSVENCWEAELSNESWPAEENEVNGTPFDKVREMFVKSLSMYTQNEILKAAEDGYGWPIELGFVVEA